MGLYLMQAKKYNSILWWKGQNAIEGFRLLMSIAGCALYIELGRANCLCVSQLNRFPAMKLNLKSCDVIYLKHLPKNSLDVITVTKSMDSIE